MTSTPERMNRSNRGDGRDCRSASILQHDRLPEDHAVGCLHRDGGIWDWDEHRATYDLAAGQAMALFDDLRSVPGIPGAIARGLFYVATSSDEDHFAVRVSDGRGGAYNWPTVPSAEQSKDVVLVGAFLAAKRRGEPLLDPHDIPLAVRRARIIGRNVPVLIFAVTEDGLRGRRFQLRPRLFARLLASSGPVDASEADIELSRWITLLAPAQLSARFEEIADRQGWRQRRGRLRAVVDFLKGAGDWREW